MWRLFGIEVPWTHSHELLELKKGKSPMDVVKGRSPVDAVKLKSPMDAVHRVSRL